MDDEEQQWKAAMERIEGESSSADDDEAEQQQQPTSVVPYELPVTKEVEGLQQQALQQIGSTAQKVRDDLLPTFWSCQEKVEGLTMCGSLCARSSHRASFQLELMDDSVQSVDRLILQIEMKKTKLFATFHETAFKGYAHISQPKENLRALLKFAPPSTSGAAAAADASQ